MIELSSETVHASCVAIDGRGVLLGGRSGAGKSDLALRLIDRGARLVADDYTLVSRRGGVLVASAPVTIAGRIEVRGIGIIAVDALAEAPIALVLDLVTELARMPDRATRRIAGVAVPSAAIVPFEASAAIKVELMLKAVAE